ncbi:MULTISPECIES: hypothetical protein [unclassified Bartonella]|uniref:hypothetical protein n=1 Tax=unclassified Bartonella TaxID=2645622 RepID=UPI0035CF48F1
MQKKFALTNETRVISNQILYRIKTLKDFSDIKAGDLGGFVEKEDNLSHDGNCWVYDDARVYENARIANDVHIYENAHIHGIAVIRENVGGSTKIKTYTERLSPYGELEIVWV